MRTHQVFLFISILLFTDHLQAQNGSYYMEHHWYGYYTETSDLFEGGKYSMYYEMYNVNYNDDYNTYTATMSGTINIEGYKYTTVWNVYGNMDDNYNVSFNYSSTVSGDELPNGLYWIYDNLTGTLYEDSDNAGEYFIHGSKPGSNGVFEISTMQ